MRERRVEVWDGAAENGGQRRLMASVAPSVSLAAGAKSFVPARAGFLAPPAGASGRETRKEGATVTCKCARGWRV